MKEIKVTKWSYKEMLVLLMDRNARMVKERATAVDV